MLNLHLMHCKDTQISRVSQKTKRNLWAKVLFNADFFVSLHPLNLAAGHRQPRIGLWCNGSTRHFGRLSSGSKPDSPTQEIPKSDLISIYLFMCTRTSAYSFCIGK